MKEIKKEKQKQQQKQRKNRKRKKYIRRAILVLGVLALCLLLFQCVGRKNDNLSGYETEVNEIVEIDESLQQEKLNAIVEEGKMNVNYLAEAVFKGKVSEKFNVKNIKNNHYPIRFSLYDEAGNCLYESKKIEPGYELSKIELSKKLDKGIYACKLKVGYDKEGNVSSVFPMTIEVR